MNVGVLALQGGFAAHERVLRRLGVEPRRVRHARDLPGLAGVVVPGGESTALRHLLEPALARALADYPLLGTCAGAILLARGALGLVDVDVRRNAYGRQRESFRAPVCTRGGPLPGVFIRAPLLLACGPGVEPLGWLDGAPVWVRQGGRMLTTFHPELTDDPRVHAHFLEVCA